MNNLSRAGFAFINVIVFFIIFTLLSGILLVLVSSHTRNMEDSIRRTKAYYVTEAGHVAVFEARRRGGAVPSSVAVDWAFSPASGNPTQTRSATTSISGGQISSALNYTLAW